MLHDATYCYCLFFAFSSLERFIRSHSLESFGKALWPAPLPGISMFTPFRWPLLQSEGQGTGRTGRHAQLPVWQRFRPTGPKKVLLLLFESVTEMVVTCSNQVQYFHCYCYIEGQIIYSVSFCICVHLHPFNRRTSD